MSEEQQQIQKTLPQTLKYLFDNYSNSVITELKKNKFMLCNQRFQWNIYQELGEQYKQGKMSSFDKFVYEQKQVPEKFEISQEEMNEINTNHKGNYYVYCAHKTNDYLQSLFSQQIEDFQICIDECLIKHKDQFTSYFQKSRCKRKCEDVYNRTVKRVFLEKVPEDERKQLIN